VTSARIGLIIVAVTVGLAQHPEFEM